MGLVNGGWRVDQADKDHHQLFPQPTQIDDLTPDRHFEDCYGPNLEFKVNDTSNERNVLILAATQDQVTAHTDVRILKIDCKYRNKGENP